MAKKAKRFEKENKMDLSDIDYGLLPGLTHVAYMNPIPYEPKEKFGGDGSGYVRTDHDKKFHKLLVR